MTGAMDHTPERRSPDLLDEAGPQLAALLGAAAEDLCTGPDELTRARHLREMATARSVPGPTRRPSPVRPVRRLVAAVAAALVAGVALGSVGALPGPIQEVASSVAARVGWDLPTPADRHAERRAPERPDTADEAGDPERVDPARPDDAGPPDSPPGRAGTAPGLTDRETPSSSVGRRPGYDGPPLDAWNRMPEWVQQRRDAAGPPSERPTAPDPRPEPPIEVPTPPDGAADGRPSAPNAPDAPSGAPDTAGPPDVPADPPAGRPEGSDAGRPPATDAVPPAAGGAGSGVGPDRADDGLPEPGSATSPPDRPVTESSQSDTESAERAQLDDRPSP
jgi:hypothetical protein